MMTRPALTNIAYLKQCLAKAGVTPQRSRSQNFLICAEPAEAVRLALKAALPVTELGAGAGALTQVLVANGFAVRAIEHDERLASHLEEELAPYRPQLNVVRGDLKKIAWQWEQPYQLVGNIPYHLSGYIIRRLTQLTPPPERVILMTQKEVAARLMAQPPHGELLALVTHLWGEVTPLLRVPKSCFWPQPKVDSAITMLVPSTSEASLKEREATVRLAKQFFQAKRKQMGGVLGHRYNLTPAEASQRLETVGIAPTARPQAVSVAQWQALYRCLHAR